MTNCQRSRPIWFAGALAQLSQLAPDFCNFVGES
jgi:hypothetical protein